MTATRTRTLALPPIIALAGYARAGKNTAAAALREHGFTERAFAEPLRAFCYEMNPLLPDGRRWAEVYDSLGYELGKEAVPGFREALQDAGIAARRHIHPDVWVTAALRDLPERLVLTDCRFVNEADAVRALGGMIVRIDRPGCEPAVNADGTVHTSETALDDYDFDLTVSNHLDTAHLRRAVLYGIDATATERQRAA